MKQNGEPMSGHEVESMASKLSPFRLPRWVPYFNPVARFLLRAGVPMGPDVLI